MDFFTALDCRLIEKRKKDERIAQLDQFRTIVSCIINTTASKKSQIKKPRDIIELESDLIFDYHKAKATLKRIEKRTARQKLDHVRKKFPNLKIPKALMTEEELKNLPTNS